MIPDTSPKKMVVLRANVAVIAARLPNHRAVSLAMSQLEPAKSNTKPNRSPNIGATDPISLSPKAETTPTIGGWSK